MEHQKITLFEEIKPPKGLLDGVCKKIEQERVKRARISVLFSGIFSTISLVLIFVAGNYLATNLSSSGVYDYVSLIFSDFSNITYFWKEVLVSVVESLPMLGLIFLFSAFLSFFGSVKKMLESVIEMNYLKLKIA